MEEQAINAKSTINYDERSGKGVASEMPKEIKGWNWGAAGLGWVWGIFNNTWLAFLEFIPYLGIAWWIVLGIKGSEWAWQNKKWESVEQFKRYQKKWNNWGIIFFVIGIIGSFLMGVGYIAGRMTAKIH
jgi:hypothetical protein